ncbi:MAG: NUDIX hydrolase [Dehalococcoidia bacterium]
MASPEETISTERAFEGRRVSVRVERVRLTDGTITTRDIVDHPNSVCIVAVDDDGNVLFVRQYRKAPERELLELPAGVLNAGEEPLAAAQRELQEETGYAAGTLRQLGYFFAAPGSMTECLYAFLATGLREDALAPDDDERIQLERLPFDEALRMAWAGDLHDAKTLACLLLAQPHMS